MITISKAEYMAALNKLISDIKKIRDLMNKIIKFKKMPHDHQLITFRNLVSVFVEEVIEKGCPKTNVKIMSSIKGLKALLFKYFDEWHNALYCGKSYVPIDPNIAEFVDKAFQLCL